MKKLFLTPTRHSTDDSAADDVRWRHFASYTLPGVILLLLGCRWAIGLILEWAELLPSFDDVEAEKSHQVLIKIRGPNVLVHNKRGSILVLREMAEVKICRMKIFSV